ncbi:MAG: hypothetical protein DI586_05985 [Micavibrio aeruginosavorus]|uniref:Uncharacterized protein n=1 Tax=Micavibrio aeruginosavorus TaxID=349221 RepID=A0A2W5FKL4_9BACT|nr:MAG: hypothetical protein DI586_05985 [Micavibrio aeruginosavorus]
MKHLFKISVPEERPTLKYLSRNFLLGYDSSAIAYVYYKGFILNLILNLMFISVYWLIYFLPASAHLEKLNSLKQNPVEIFVQNYMQTLPLSFIIVGFYLLLLISFNWQEVRKNFILGFDLQQKVKEIVKKNNGVTVKFISLYVATLIIFPCFIFFSFPQIYAFLSEYDLYNYFYDFRAQNRMNLFLYSAIAVICAHANYIVSTKIIFLLVEVLFFKSRLTDN